MTISTRDLSALPDVEGLRQLLRSLAMLDAILCEDWEGRYFSFDSRWGQGQMLGSMRNGSGDGFYAVFNDAGCFLKGFAHEALMSPHQFDPPSVAPGVLDNVPPEFAEFLKEPAFDIENTTFCIWRRREDDAWHHGNVIFPDGADPDGSEDLLAMLDGDPETYRTWAEDYFGDDWEDDRRLESSDVARIYHHELLTDALVTAINPDRKFSEVTKDAKEIGYPL